MFDKKGYMWVYCNEPAFYVISMGIDPGTCGVAFKHFSWSGKSFISTYLSPSCSYIRCTSALKGDWDASGVAGSIGGFGSFWLSISFGVIVCPFHIHIFSSPFLSHHFLSFGRIHTTPHFFPSFLGCLNFWYPFLFFLNVSR